MRDASRGRIARLFARLATKQIAPPSTAPKGLHEKCPAAALRDSSNRTSVRSSSRALHLSTFRANAAPSGFCISLLVLPQSVQHRPRIRPHTAPDEKRLGGLLDEHADAVGSQHAVLCSKFHERCLLAVHHIVRKRPFS